MAKILVVDDDVSIRDALSVTLPLQWDTVTVVTADGGEAALRAFSEQDPDVVLLDVSLPDVSGFEVLRRIRRISDVPVLMLTAHGGEMDQVRGLELGADEYITKPFGAMALMARIKAVLRRAGLPARTRSAADVVVGPLAVQFQSRRVTVHGQLIHLTPVEFKLLYHLARNAGHLLMHEALVDRVWGTESVHTADHLKVFISRIRAKLDRAGGPSFIETERRLGYSFVHQPVGVD